MLSLLSESVSLLDMMWAFAHMCSSACHPFVRPEMKDEGPLALDGARHPVLELLSDKYVPNKVFLSEVSSMCIITGPNMSGKSCYLRMVGVNTVLAHIGCYVVASWACFSLVDRLVRVMETCIGYST